MLFLKSEYMEITKVHFWEEVQYDELPKIVQEIYNAQILK